MGSENNADQAWALVSSWLWDGAESALVAWALDIRRAIIRRFRHPDNPGAAMQNTQILSTQPPLPDSGPPERSARSVRAAAGAGPGGQPPRGRALVFDACQVGVVLRAVLFVELVVGVGAMYGAGNPVEWLATLALLTGGALPATLLWLGTACSLKTVLQRLTTVQQYLAGRRAGGRTPAATTARLTELQSRIRPHFLFNTLNSAIALVREEPAKAESLLEDLSDLFRVALIEQGESTTLAEEITLARRYLGIEEVRFGKRLQVQWNLDPRTDGARLPPLLLQPLVENAVKHGVEPSDRGGKRRVLTELRGSRVVVRITNPLPPKEGKNGHGNGEDTAPRGHGIALANVRARLALLHDVQGEFTAGVQDGLYQVRITLPAPDPQPQPRPRGGRSTAPPARRSSGNPGNRHGSRAAPLQRRMVDSPNDNNSPLRDHEHPDR